MILADGTEVAVDATTARWRCPLRAVDADGCPRAYHPLGRAAGALDLLANAGGDGDWYGLVTSDGTVRGQPIVQRAPDPAPGFFVSQTALSSGPYRPGGVWPFVDAEVVPYASIPPELEPFARVGDLGLAVLGEVAIPFIVADVGPRGKLGEGSLALARALGVPCSPVNGGDARPVNWTIYRGSAARPAWPRDLDEIGETVTRLALTSAPLDVLA